LSEHDEPFSQHAAVFEQCAIRGAIHGAQRGKHGVPHFDKCEKELNAAFAVVRFRAAVLCGSAERCGGKKAL